MESIEWWESLDAGAKEWLTEHNGESVRADVLAQIIAAGGDVTSGSWWVGKSGPEGFHLSDDAVDWIEEKANSE